MIGVRAGRRPRCGRGGSAAHASDDVDRCAPCPDAGVDGLSVALILAPGRMGRMRWTTALTWENTRHRARVGRPAHRARPAWHHPVVLDQRRPARHLRAGPGQTPGLRPRPDHGRTGRHGRARHRGAGGARLKARTGLNRRGPRRLCSPPRPPARRLPRGDPDRIFATRGDPDRIFASSLRIAAPYRRTQPVEPATPHLHPGCCLPGRAQPPPAHQSRFPQGSWAGGTPCPAHFRP
jgi:hypothetical protein